MSSYTNLGCGFFGWEPLRDRPLSARFLFLGLYASAPAKRLIPGLFHGGVGAIADACGLSAQDAVEGMAELARPGPGAPHGLIEHDRATTVTRLVLLPDRGERPSNGKVLRAWWHRFQSVPSSRVRDRHVATLKWLLGDCSADHRAAWDETFATVRTDRNVAKSVVPAPQVELFSASPNGYGIGVVEPIPYEPNDINGPDTVCHTNRFRNRSTVSGSGSGKGESEGEEPTASAPAKAPLPFTVAQLLATLSETSRGRFVGEAFDKRLAPAITAAIRAVTEAGFDLSDIAVCGAWLAAGGMAYRTDLGPTWVAKTGNLVEAVSIARAWGLNGQPNPNARVDRPTKPVAPGSVAPAPAAAFGTGGRRRLS